MRNKDSLEAILGELLAQSLIAWGVAGTVQTASDGSILLTCGETRIGVQAAAPDVPFRWMVRIGDRTRGATSLLALLRLLRAALDPDYAASRVRVIFPGVAT